MPGRSSRSASKRAERALARAAGDRRILAGAAVAAGAALVAGLARELAGDGPGHGDESGNSDTYRIERPETAAEAVGRIARGRLDRALALLTDGLGEDVGTAVHEARKDLKKARTLLRLARDRIGHDTYRRENTRLRDAGRALSGSRDAEAKVETLDALTERFANELPAGFASLREALEQERDAMAAGHGEGAAPDRQGVTQAVELIKAVRADVADWRYSKQGWKLLAPGLERGYRRGRSRFRDVLRDPSSENVHELRKRVKDLWYHLRLLRDSWPSVLTEMGDQAHELSDLLGDHHDLSVLLQDVQRRPKLVGEGDGPAVVDMIETRQEELIEGAVPIGERLYAERSKAFIRRHRAYWRAWRSD
jgi:CHAD domain-containing protein